MKLEILFPILILSAGFLYFIIPRISKKYFARPLLFMEINPNEGITMQRRHIARIENSEIKYGNDPEAESLYGLVWKFDLIIRNNSENAAYNIKMFPQKTTKGKLTFNSIVNENKTLAAHQELVIPFEFYQEKESKHKDVDKLDTVEPDFFDEFKILLDYKNEGKTSFNSILDVKSKQVCFKKISQKKIKKNWC
ncbi:hypothetical protein [Cyclobacterium sp. SYSU L10401]|uniref:hypothetical protein n=1 Tax=Cyclobacterium sp. SYSU L10401 TaxID=2678657 RepID=UPI0013D5216D|nr:hypothetical protein [Cyclobacterium sp. SYSU L10401]